MVLSWPWFWWCWFETCWSALEAAANQDCCCMRRCNDLTSFGHCCYGNMMSQQYTNSAKKRRVTVCEGVWRCLGIFRGVRGEEREGMQDFKKWLHDILCLDKKRWLPSLQLWHLHQSTVVQDNARGYGRQLRNCFHRWFRLWKRQIMVAPLMRWLYN